MTMKMIDEIVSEALGGGVFTAAQVLVKHAGEIVHRKAYGFSQGGADARPIETDSLFDLSSLTKPLATATATAALVGKGEIRLDDPVCSILRPWDRPEKKAVTIRHLLEHASGLSAWKAYFKELGASEDPREALFEAVAIEKLDCIPGEKAVYSDLGFIALGQLVETVSGSSLDAFCEREIYSFINVEDLFFLPVGDQKNAGKIGGRAIAATEDCEYRGLLIGEVHDDNAHFAGGVMGHAGLFGSADGIMALLLEWKRALSGESILISKEVALDFIFPGENAPRNSFVLGWDRPTWKVSQAGSYISPHSIGHLGFTGTSAWLDHDRDLAVVFLTNRVHPSRDERRMPSVRRALHNAVFEALGATSAGPYEPPPSPDRTDHIHMIAVAGAGMGALAGMLKTAGYQVTGSDEAIYPPMSGLLEEKGIPVRQPFDPANLDPAPDLSVVGNVCTRDHVEVTELRRRGLAYDSFPGVLERFFLAGKKPLVVSGTHGKTTTCAMLAWLLEHAGMDPGFMIGGLVRNFNASGKLGKGGHFVVEGDEYDSAYFDKRPKFLHYRPFGAIVTGIEFDHADIYDSLEEITGRFREFVRLIPEEGALAACWDYETVRDIAGEAACRVVRYGEHPDAEWRAVGVKLLEGVTRFILMNGKEAVAEIDLPMPGHHNIANAVAASALMITLGLKAESLGPALMEFEGVARRQELKGVWNGVRVIDDFAHHPTAVKLTLEGLRKLYPNGRLLAAFEPRTNTSSRKFFQDEYAASFHAADLIAIGKPSRMDRIPPEERLDVKKLADEISAGGTPARHIADVEEMADYLVKSAKPGDCIAVLSNGGFGGLHEKLLERLKEEERG